MTRKILIIWALVCVLGTGTFVQAAGQKIPDFNLASATSEKTFNLKDAKGRFVALHYLLKTECPVCLRHTREYAEKAGELPDVVQIFIKPDSIEEIRKWSASLPTKEQNQLPIFRDPNAELAKKLKIPDGYKFHGEVVHYPALILINPNGEEVFRHIGKNNSDRYSFENLKQKVAEFSTK